MPRTKRGEMFAFGEPAASPVGYSPVGVINIWLVTGFLNAKTFWMLTVGGSGFFSAGNISPYPLGCQRVFGFPASEVSPAQRPHVTASLLPPAP